MSSMSATHLVLACLISALPGPPGIRYEDAYVQLFPVDKTKCPTIDPVRDIAYQLFTRNNPLMPDVLAIGDDAALAHSHMNFSDPTIIFFHAFFESSTGTTAWIIKTAYLHKKQHNVILLNAPRLEAGPWYFTAARNTRVVGEYTATFIDYLVSRGMSLQSLHLVGLSLGAQMAGVAGSNVRSGRVPRITGVDPAGPVFTKLPNSLKLDKSDAEFVDVIHTDAGIFGYPKAIGHADFWPNQGISPQPGCTFPEIKRRNPDTILELFFCSHWRSYQFYAESVVNENGFLAISCNNWKEFVTGKCNPDQLPINMGYNTPITARGNYYLATNPESPFSLEGNPKTLAESKYSEPDNYYPVANPETQISFQESTNSTSESGYENYGNMYYPAANTDVEFLLQEDLKSLKESVYNTQDNYYPTQFYSQKIPAKESIYDAQNGYYPKINAETQFYSQKRPSEESVHDTQDSYYSTTNTEAQVYWQQSPSKESVYNTQDSNYPTTNSETQFYSQKIPSKESVYNTQGNYDSTTNSETNVYLQKNPPKMYAEHRYYY